MFYAASKRRTALLECRVKKGDIVYLSEWLSIDDIPYNKLLSMTENDEKKFFRSGYIESVHSYIETIFTRRVDSEFSNDYKISAALTERMTSYFTEDEEFNIKSDGRIAIQYPSIFDRKNSYNTCMCPELAASKIEMFHVIEAVVEDARGMHVEIRVLDTAFSFPKGTIAWTGSPNHLPLPKDEGGITMPSHGNDWLLAVRDGPTGDADLRNFLLE